MPRPVHAGRSNSRPRPAPGRSGPAARRGILLCAGLLVIALRPGPSNAAEDPVPEIAAVAGLSGSRAPDSLEGLPVRSVQVQVNNVFDPLPRGPLRFVGVLANRVHVKTRPSVIRDQLLVRPGDRWSEGQAEEAMRQLRTLDFLEPLRLTASRAGDSVDVDVATRDVWTTQPEFDLERGGGKQFGQFGFIERNLAGFGKSVALGYREDPVGITRSVSVSDPGVAGSRLVLRASGARGTSGASDAIETLLPFYAIETPWSFGLSGIRRSGTAHLFRDNAEVASLGEHVEDTRFFVGRGWRYGDAVRRLTLSYRILDRRLDPTLPAPGVFVPESFTGPEEFLRMRVALLEMRFWRPHYIERTGVLRVDQVEDFDLGRSLNLGLGLSPRLFGSQSNYGIFRARFDAGIATPLGFGQLTSAIDGRWRKSAEEVEHLTRGRWIWQARPDHTIEASLLGAGGFRMPRNYQVVFGGLNGLRAYPVHAIAGARALRWNLEDRHMLVRDVFEFVSIGSAVFVDGARGWGPGAEDVGWFHCAGVGVRLAPPRAAIGPVLRADVAWPLSPTRDGRRDAVLSIGSSRAF